MHIWYGIILGVTMACGIVYSKEASVHNQDFSFKQHVVKVLGAIVRTCYRHPFMASWSLHSIFFPSRKVIAHTRNSTITIEESRGVLTWLINAVLLGDFTHTLLHLYNASHEPCDRDQKSFVGKDKNAFLCLRQNGEFVYR